jgi:hypothetical protein
MNWKSLLIVAGLAGVGAMFFGVAGAAAGGAGGALVASKLTK